jgi:hypothetical protein
LIHRVGFTRETQVSCAECDNHALGKSENAQNILMHSNSLKQKRWTADNTGRSAPQIPEANMIKAWSFRISLMFSVLLLLAATAFSQGTTTRITGTVTDAQGAPVGGATVTITREGGTVVLTAQTSDNGVYVFDLIQPGTYDVSIEKAGFNKFVSTGNSALVNQPATINAKLVVGDVSATVNVVGTAEQVQTSTSGNLGGTVEQRTVEALPIVGTRGRNPLDILNFQPGVTNGANTGGGVHINGSRDRAFNFTLDGIDINESTAGGSNFTPLRPNPDSIQEFQIVTSGFTAELGRSSGAQVTFVTRSGSNEFHGNLYEIYQSKGFHARSYASNVNGTAKENFIQHIFGGSVGGPLFNPGFGEGTPVGWMRDKAFFFVNLQMLRANDALLQTRTVYTPTARTGVFRWVRGGQNGTGVVDASGNPIAPPCGGSATTNCIDSYNVATGSGITLDPVLMNYINAMPEPNSYSATGDGLNIAGFLFNSPQQEKQYDFVSKVDFRVNDQNSFYVRWANGEQNTFGDSVNGGRPRFPDAPNFVDTFRTPKNLAVNWRWSPTAKFVNETVVGWSKFGFKFLTPEPDPVYSFIFNLPTDINTNFSYNARSFRTWQFVDNITFDLSPHVIKAGANIRLGLGRDDRSSVAGGAIEPAINFSRTVNSNFSFPTPLPTGASVINSADRTRLENMINDQLGRVGNYTLAFVSDPNNPSVFAPIGTRWIFDANHYELDFYLQDTWKVNPNLLLDLGFRWEPKFTPRSAGGRPMLAPDKDVTLGAAPANNIRWTERDLFDDDWGIFLPSLGVAWDPFGKGKTSLRANYRMSSDRFATFLFSSFIFQSTPGNNALAANNAFGQGGGLFRNLPPLTAPGTPDSFRQPPAFSTNSLTVMDPGIEFPTIHSLSFSFQQEVWDGNVIEVNYINKKGRDLFGGYNTNQVNIHGTLPGISGDFLSEFNAIRGNAAYNSPLINRLFTGNAADNDGTARFRALNGTAITQGSVATLALAASQKVCVAGADVTGGLCTSGQIGQRILDIWGFGTFFQPFSQYTGGLFVVDSNDYSNYNGLEITFRRRMKDGLSFQFGYTFATSKDTRSFDPVFTTVQAGVTSQTGANYPFDNANRDLNYSYSDFDRRHSLLGTYVYELPFGEGKPFGSDAPAVLKYIISGWQLAGTLRVTSGRPFTVFSGLFTVTQTVGTTANCSGCTRDMGEVHQGNYDNTGGRNWYFTDEQRRMMSQPAPGEQGNLPRNFFVGPGYFETDLSVLRKFKFGERYSFDVRVDAKNLTNTPNFAAPTAVLPAGLGQANPANPFGTNIFGRINADVTNNARRIQISGRFVF